MKGAYLLLAILSPLVFALQLWLCKNIKNLLLRLIPLVVIVLGLVFLSYPTIKSINWQSITTENIYSLLLLLSMVLALICVVVAWGVHYMLRFYEDKNKEDDNIAK